MSLMTKYGLDRLTEHERRELYEELAEQFGDGPPPLSEESRAELLRRCAAVDAGEAAVHPWEEVEARLRAKYGL